MFQKFDAYDNAQCRGWKYDAAPWMDGVVKDLRLELRVEDDLAEEQALVSEYD